MVTTASNETLARILERLQLLPAEVVRGLLASAEQQHKWLGEVAAENGVPQDLARGLVAVLSSYNPRATGKSGEIGLMQLMPQTAQAMGFTGNARDLYDPETNLTYGMRYLAKAQELGGGSTCQTVHRYTAGHFAKGMTAASTRFCTKVQTAMRQ